MNSIPLKMEYKAILNKENPTKQTNPILNVLKDKCLLRLIYEFGPNHREEYKKIMKELILHSIKRSIKKREYRIPDIFEQIDKLEYSNSQKLDLLQEISFKKYLNKALNVKRDIVLGIINKNPMFYSHLPQGYKYDKGIINLAMTKNPKIFEFIPTEIKREYIEIAVNQNVKNWSLITLDDEKIFPYTIIRLAKETIEKDINNFSLFSNTFLENNLEVNELVKTKLLERIQKKGISSLKKISWKVLWDEKIMMDIIIKYPMALKACSKYFKRNRNIVLAAVSQCGNALQYANDELKDNRDIVLAAVRQNGNSYKFASNELKNDEEVILVSYYNSRNFFHYYSDRNKHIIIKNVFLSLSFLSHRDKKYKYPNLFIEDVFGDEDLRKEIGKFL